MLLHVTYILQMRWEPNRGNWGAVKDMTFNIWADNSALDIMGKKFTIEL